jgi:hypothetical protein
MIATLILIAAVLALAVYALHLRAQLSVTREELGSATHNARYYYDLWCGRRPSRPSESFRREGVTTYETIESLTHSRGAQ